VPTYTAGRWSDGFVRCLSFASLSLRDAENWQLPKIGIDRRNGSPVDSVIYHWHTSCPYVADSLHVALRNEQEFAPLSGTTTSVVSATHFTILRGGRHEMLNELNRDQVRTIYVCRFRAVLGNRNPDKESQ
jgi:hypothetical protein